MDQFPDDVSVGIVAHNARASLPATLESLLDAGCRPEQITVVDVASTDDTREWLEAEQPEIKVVAQSANLGPNPARNAVILSAKTPYVLVMDSDVRMERKALPALYATMNGQENVAIASPLVVYAGRPDVIQYAGSWMHFVCESINRWQGRSVEERGKEVEEIGCASGNALLVRRDVAVNVGLFDESLFMGKDDGDFTHRVVLAGYRILEVPEARVRHDAGERSTGFIQYQIRNRWYFMLRNYQWRTLFLASPVLVPHELLELVVLTIHGHALDYFRAIGGLLKMLPGLKRERAKVNTLRRRNDWEVLQADPMVVRADFLRRPLLRWSKSAYDRLLQGYWRMLRKTLLR